MPLTPLPAAPPAPDLVGATAPDVLRLAREHNVRFLRLPFTDILAVNKNVAAKREEWRDYITPVTRWELDRYPAKY